MEKENKTSFLRRLGVVPLILFWLAAEYLTGYYIGSLLHSSTWTRWSVYTGFGGISLWILTSSFLLYLALFRKWQYTIPLVIVIVGPILYSYTLQSSAGTEVHDEWIGRTAAWISVLVLISFTVKEFTRKK
jgi:hypothetical protein